ncbi:hypothetical protein K402DRAFT_397567 [Aulographum hederae CBS 113979]|uniref:F-box domain-containing protein n=1 Tax=Aulographum hederae CBS 113979 TaxID=1176131 RepID=A0A6G1GP23_9PEZI|nr:hypothetical protein K402DRAFT_397567 [Aulographum hederae CBS 113979]
MSFLPTELILHVIDSLVPGHDNAPVAHPPNHGVTRTLISFTLVSTSTYSLATRYLYSHCLYLDSPTRLRLLLQSLVSLSLPRKLLPPIAIAPCLRSLYLAPFEGDILDNLPIAQWTFQLISTISPTLKRLVVDMPLRNLEPWDDRLNVRPPLRTAFSQLVNLEEFCSARDELFLDLHDRTERIIERPVWTLWPKLRKLALYNQDIEDPLFVAGLMTLRNITHLALTRTDGLGDRELHQEFLHCGEEKLRVLLIDDWNAQTPGPELMRRAVAKSGEGQVDICLVNAGIKPETPDGVIEGCQVAVRDRAIDRTLWDSVGEVIGGRF